MKKVIVILILTCVFCLPVGAQSSYDQLYNNTNADSLSSYLDEQTRNFFEENDISIKDANWVNNLTKENVLKHIWQFLTSGAKTPIKTGVLIASVIFLTAALTAFSASVRFETAIYAAVLAISAFIANDIWQSVYSATSVVKGISSFMLSFVPVFASILALSGKTVTAPAMSSLLLGVTELVSFAASFAVLPLMGGYLAVSISSGVSPLVSTWGITESIKKLSMWILSLLGTLFVGVLGIQTTVNAAADSVSLRTAKFILGTSVPVAGGVLSEAASTISASMGLLRSSVGIYGVVAIAFMLLPVVIELVLWRVMLMINISLGEIFSMPKITGILKAVDSMLSVLLGVVLIVGGMFIISLTVVVMAGKT